MKLNLEIVENLKDPVFHDSLSHHPVYPFQQTLHKRYDTDNNELYIHARLIIIKTTSIWWR